MPPFAARRQPQLSLEELLHVRWLLGSGLALLSIWTLFYLEASIWPVAMLATGAILLVSINPTLPSRVPPWTWRFGVPVIGVAFAVDLLLHEMIPAFVRLSVLLVLFRTVSHRSRREDLQLVVLCMFLIVMTGVLTVSLVFAVQILLFTGLAMAFLFVVNLIRDAGESDAAADAGWPLLSRKRLMIRLWQTFDLRIVLLALVLFCVVVLISTVIFLAIPRFQMDGGFSLLSLNRSRSLTGFSETIALGEVTDITQDDSVAMRVDVLGTEAVSAVPYWRMVVLDEYDHGTFRVSKAVLAAGARSVPAIEFSTNWIPPSGDISVRDALPRPVYRIFLEGGVSRYLPLPGVVREVRFRELQDVVENRHFRVLATERESAALLSYQIEGADSDGIVPDPHFASMRLRAPPIDPRHEAAVGPELRQRFLDYPSTTLAVPLGKGGLDFLRAAVDEISGGETLDALTFARRACEHLARHHRYALGVSLPVSEEREDPALKWMRGELPGHCEFFAAAFTLLSRMAGHPTRAVTGFKGGTWNAYEGYFMVRHSDAHAWCEVYDGQGAWVRVDPTPGGGGVTARVDNVPKTALAADHSFAAYTDSLRMLWYRRIVNFDRGSQRHVVASLRGIGGTISLWTQAVVVTVRDRIKAWMNSPWTFDNKGDILSVLVVVLLTATLMRRCGMGTSDVTEWFRRGEPATRRRAGELLIRLRRRLGGRRPRRWDENSALMVAADLEVIRYARPLRWPHPRSVFRAARRLL